MGEGVEVGRGRWRDRTIIPADCSVSFPAGLPFSILALPPLWWPVSTAVPSAGDTWLTPPTPGPPDPSLGVLPSPACLEKASFPPASAFLSA